MMAQKWLFRLWQLAVGLLLLASVGYGVFDSTHSLWAVAFVLGVILVAALLLRNCLNPSHTSYHFFEDDSTCGLHAWEATPEWSVSPLREGESGIQLVYHYHLPGVLLLKTYRRFVDGVIECQICLEPGAMFSLLPRGSLEEIEAIVRMACIVHHTDYWRTGRTLDKLGLEGLSVSELTAYVTEGIIP